jgi:hypothetical protein
MDGGAADGGLRTDGGGTDGGATCAEFVTLQNGQLMVEGRPWAFKSVNFHVDIGAAPKADIAHPTQPLDYDYFIAPSGYDPDNNGYCRDPASWGPRICCRGQAQCEEQLEQSHIDRIQQMGASSVRLLMDRFRIENDANGNPYPYFPVGIVDGWNPDAGTFNQVKLRLQLPAERDIAINLILRAVRLLDRHGIRSLLLLNGRTRYKAFPVEDQIFRNFISTLATALKDETGLVGYDFYNEPTYNDPGIPITKLEARDLVQGWVSAIRGTATGQAGDRVHLLTLGNATVSDALGTWDPFVLPIDFVSYHMYPGRPPEASDFVRREVYESALGGCDETRPCGAGRKPFIIGETGFAVDTAGPPPTVAWGDEAAQTNYLTMVSTLSHNCGFQGLQWWVFGDVHWGSPTEDHFGLWTWGGQQLNDLVLRPAGVYFRDQLQMVGARGVCGRPDHFYDVYGQPRGTTVNHTYHGKVVVSGSAAPIPDAIVGAWKCIPQQANPENCDWGARLTTIAESNGQYALASEVPLVAVTATFFGHKTPSGLVYVCPPRHPGGATALADFRLEPIPLNQLPAYDPPSQRVAICP